MNILMINLHSSRNAGDAALTQVGIEQLAAAFNGAEIILAMNDPGSHCGPERTLGSFFTWINRSVVIGLPWLLFRSMLSVLIYRLFSKQVFPFMNADQRALLAAYYRADIVVSCAGNFLYSGGRLGLSFLLSAFTIAFARFAKKPLYGLPQSIGPFRRSWERRLTRWIYSYARLVLVREPVSLEIAHAIGLPPDRCLYVPDIAFALSPVPESEARQYLERYGVTSGNALLGMTVMNYTAQNRAFDAQSIYEESMARVIRWFVDQCAGRVILFSQVTGPSAREDDRIATRRVKHLVEDLGDRVILIEEVCPPDLLKGMYGLTDLFIGTRMHSNIFALAQFVPVVAIEYFHKTRGIMQALKLDEWIIDIRSNDADRLVKQVGRAWSIRERTRSQLEHSVPEMVDQAGRAGQLIAERHREGVA